MPSSLLSYPEIEKALIAKLIIKPETIGDVGTLVPSDFAYPDWGKVYSTLLTMHADGRAFDVPTIESLTGVTINLMEMRQRSTADISEYADKIKQAASRRRLIDALNKARINLEDDDDDPVAIVERNVGDVLRGESSATLRTIDTVAQEYLAAYAGRAAIRGLPYGLPKIDSILLPAKPGRLIMVASRPGIGKTAFAETVADEWAKHGPVLFVNLEMSAEELTDRAVARMSGHAAKGIILGELDTTEVKKYVDQRRELPITYMDKGKASPGDINSAAMRVKMLHGGISGIIIDYLQLVSHVRDNEVYRVADISHAAKRLARDAGCPVLALAQTSRRIEYEDRPPRMSDLRDSGMLEADADAIVVITGDPQQPIREFHILKQRQGSTGRVEVYFDADTQRWLNERPSLEEEW